MNYKYKILHLEDVATDAELAKKILKESHINFEQLVIDTEKEYLEALDSFIPDLILCDHSLPSFDCFEALKILKAKNLSIPFIVITATLTEEVANSLVREGADDYVMKDRLARLPHAVINATEKFRFEKERKQLMDEAFAREAHTKDVMNQMANKILLATRVAGIGIWEYIFKDNTFIADDVTLHHFGLQIADFDGNYETVLKYLHPEDQPKVRLEMVKALEINRDVDIEYRIVRADNTTLYIKAVAMVQLDNIGVPIRLIGTHQDISAGKKAEQEVRTTLKHLAEAQRLAKMGSWNYDFLQDKLAWSDELYNVFGADRSTFKETHGSFVNLVDEADRKMVLQTSASAQKTGAPFVIEYRITTPNGVKRIIQEHGYGQKDETGKVICVFGTAQDITERKKSENKIRESEFRYRSLISQATDAICIADSTLKFTDINQYACEVLGYSMEEGLALSLHDVVFEDDFEENPLHIKQVKPGEIFRNERRFKRKDGTALEMEVSVQLLEDGSYFMFGHDISERKKTEIYLKELNEHLQKSVKELAVSNAELEQFAYVASHDLQEPLRMVTSFLTQLERKYGHVLDDKAKVYIGYAVDGAKRMRKIILDLLEYSKVGRSGHAIEWIDLEEMVEEIRILCRKQIADKSATIVTTTLPVIQAVIVPMRQVFQNLVSNALQYSRDGVPVLIRITAEESDKQWLFSFSDNGIGIEAEYYEKIFVIFQRLHTNDTHPGTGMGLTITKKIIENMGGQIWVESEDGKGSTFSFTIAKPRKEEK